MIRGAILLTSFIAVIGYAASAEAKSIKSQIPRDAVVAFCTTAGPGEQTGQFTLPDGTTITGSIACEGEDLQVAATGGAEVSDDSPGPDDATSEQPGTDDVAGDDHGGDASGNGNSGSGSDGDGGGDN